MRRHPFDPVALVLGALAAAAGLLVLAGRSLAADADVLVPAGLVGLGGALLIRLAAPRGGGAVPPDGDAQPDATPTPPRDADPT